MGGRLQLNTAFREHLGRTRQRGFKFQTLAVLCGFGNSSNLRAQIRKPFAPTRYNRERWRTVAVLTNFDGEPLDQESSS